MAASGGAAVVKPVAALGLANRTPQAYHGLGSDYNSADRKPL